MITTISSLKNLTKLPFRGHKKNVQPLIKIVRPLMCVQFGRTKIVRPLIGVDMQPLIAVHVQPLIDD